jgi:CSLREA domain-containing protein
MNARMLGWLGPLLLALPLPAAVYTVDSTGDEPDASLDGVCATAGGACTLRVAIREANSGAGDTIAFNIPGPGPHTIALQSRLPEVLDADTTIDGYTQPGSQPNTTATGGLDAVPLIVVTSDDTWCLEVGGDNRSSGAS